jgi:hypothetical protein
VVFRESRVVDEVWAGVAPRALAGEALLIVLDNFEYDVVVAYQAAWNGVGAPRNAPVEIIDKSTGRSRRPRRHQLSISAARRF